MKLEEEKREREGKKDENIFVKEIPFESEN